MAFCAKCGNKTTEGDMFCATCGAKQSSEPTRQPMRGYTTGSASPSGTSQSLHTAAQKALHFTLSLACLSIFAVLTQDNLGLIISVALAAFGYFGAVRPLQTGAKGNATSVLMLAAGISGVIGVLVLLKGALLVGALDIAAAALGYTAWQSLNRVNREI